MSETKLWAGGCHCGDVQFEVEMALDGLKINVRRLDGVDAAALTPTLFDGKSA